jgi:hypothetical protein
MGELTSEQIKVHNEQTEIYQRFLKQIQKFEPGSYSVSALTNPEEPQVYYVRLDPNQGRFLALTFEKWKTNFFLQSIKVSVAEAN